MSQGECTDEFQPQMGMGRHHRARGQRPRRSSPRSSANHSSMSASRLARAAVNPARPRRVSFCSIGVCLHGWAFPDAGACDPHRSG